MWCNIFRFECSAVRCEGRKNSILFAKKMARISGIQENDLRYCCTFCSNFTRGGLYVLQIPYCLPWKKFLCVLWGLSLGCTAVAAANPTPVFRLLRKYKPMNCCMGAEMRFRIYWSFTFCPFFHGPSLPSLFYLHRTVV